MLYIMNYHKWNKSSTCNSRWEAFIRGLDSSDEYLTNIVPSKIVIYLTVYMYVKMIAEQRARLRAVISDQVYSMLERWLLLVTKNNNFHEATVS